MLLCCLFRLLFVFRKTGRGSLAADETDGCSEWAFQQASVSTMMNTVKKSGDEKEKHQVSMLHVYANMVRQTKQNYLTGSFFETYQ